jgi:hypothetical protein
MADMKQIAPDPRLREVAREARYEIDKLPDHYVKGADGGLYHATHPDADEIIVKHLAAEGERARRADAPKLLAIRDALVKGDVEEAYHQLYSLADPEFCNLQPWAELERIRREGGEDA